MKFLFQSTCSMSFSPFNFFFHPVLVTRLSFSICSSSFICFVHPINSFHSSVTAFRVNFFHVCFLSSNSILIFFFSPPASLRQNLRPRKKNHRPRSEPSTRSRPSRPPSASSCSTLKTLTGRRVRSSTCGWTRCSRGT
jgi:hypothetical protein